VTTEAKTNPNDAFAPSERITSPKGVFVFPHLNKPDTKFAGPGEKGVYKTRHRISAEQAKTLKAKAEEALKAFIEASKARIEASEEMKPVAKKKALALLDRTPHYPIDAVLDEDSGEETGMFEVTYSIAAEGVVRKTGRSYSNKPVIFDNGNPPKQVDVLIYNNAAGKVTFVMQPYSTETAFGVKFKPLAVQLIDLAPSQGGGAAREASDFGFGAEEGSFDSSKFNRSEADTPEHERVDDGSASEEGNAGSALL
jgi:hypothetical protein